MELSGDEVGQLQQALLSAFNETELKQLVRIRLDNDLTAITSGGTDLSRTVFDLIQWAERTGQTSTLITAALAQNPDNSKLKAFAHHYESVGGGSRFSTPGGTDQHNLSLQSSPRKNHSDLSIPKGEGRSYSSVLGQSAKYRAFLTGLYLGVLLLFAGVVLQSPPCDDCFLNSYASVYFVVPLAGSILGLRKTLTSGFAPSYVQVLCLIVLSTGTLLWSIGQMLWSFQAIVLGIEVPYPSVSDLFFVPSIFCWLIGISLIYKLIGTDALHVARSVAPYVIFFWTITIILTIYTYMRQDPTAIQTNDPIKFVLDVGYPMVDALNFAMVLALILSSTFEKLSYDLRVALVVLLVAVMFNWAGDLSFSVTTTLSSLSLWAFSNGNWTDWLFCTGVFLHAMAVLFFPIKDRREYFTITHH